MSARLIGGTSGASAGPQTENLIIKTSQQVYIRWYGSSKPKERSIHEPIAFSPSYGAASKNVSRRANAYVFKRLHLRLDGNRRPSTQVWLSYWTRSFKPRGQPCATGEV